MTEGVLEEPLTLDFESEHALEDLFDSRTNWEAILINGCEDPTNILESMVGFVIESPGLSMFWNPDDLTCFPTDPSANPWYHAGGGERERSHLTSTGQTIQLYEVNTTWIGLLEILDVDGPGFSLFAPSFIGQSENGVVIFKGCAPCVGRGLHSQWRLFSMTSDATDRKYIYSCSSNFCNPILSPDGSTFIMTTNHWDFDLFEIDGTHRREIIDIPDGQVVTGASWSPSGSHIAYWSSSHPGGEWDVFITDPNGHENRQLTDMDSPGWGSLIWASDETQIAFGNAGQWSDKYYMVEKTASQVLPENLEEIDQRTYESLLG
jgi:hypothetical protein